MLRSKAALLLALSLAVAAVARAEDDGGAMPASPAAAAAAADAPSASSAGTVPSDPAPAATPAPTPLVGDEVQVSADRVEGGRDERVFVAEGAVTIRHRDVRLVADRVVYNETTKDILADGNVVLDSGTDRVQGEHLELNLETRVGFMDRAQGFIQTYYFTGNRIEKLGPDHYFLKSGSFTTCEGRSPSWNFRATSIDVTVDEYLHAWNSTFRVKSLPLLYFPYAVFPVKRERSTGMLIPSMTMTSADGFSLLNSFYWAPRDNYDATIGLEYLQRTGWKALGEFRYMFSSQTHGTVDASYLLDRNLDTRSWSVATRNSQELPLGINAQIDISVQSDRNYLSTQGDTLEERSTERSSSSFYLNRSWSSWNASLSGRYDQSLLTDEKSTITRFPELKIDRTSTKLFGSGLYLKLAASGVRLKSEDSSESIATNRWYVAPEATWPISLGSVARIIPAAGVSVTDYSRNLAGAPETRTVPTFKLSLEGPRPYRIWNLEEGGRFEKLKHLIEPRISYAYTPKVDQSNIPQFDSVDYISQANKVEYSLTNTLYAKVRAATKPGAATSAAANAPAATATAPTIASPAAPAVAAPGAPPSAGDQMAAGDASKTGESATTDDPPAPGETAPPAAGMAPDAETAAETEEPRSTTQELFWFKLSQNYTFDDGTASGPEQPFSDLSWEARTRPSTGIELTWKGSYDVYGEGFGYHNLSLSWKVSDTTSFHADYRSSTSSSDFVDLKATFPLWNFGLEGRTRYNIDEGMFVENRIGVKYSAQCWDVTVGYVHWTEEYEYSLQFSLKGVGTIVRI